MRSHLRNFVESSSEKFPRHFHKRRYSFIVHRPTNLTIFSPDGVRYLFDQLIRKQLARVLDI